MVPKLSICIPTFNRAKFLPEAIESIVKQAAGRVEIVISDNASTDETPSLVAAWMQQFPFVRYFRWDENVGADRNFLKVISLAQTDYCWLLGSDDILEDGAVDAVLQLIEKYPDISGISVNGYTYDTQLAARTGETVNVSGKLKQSQYFDQSDALFGLMGEYLGYISAQIVNRAKWNEVIHRYDVQDYCISYVHLYVIARMIQAHPSWYFLSRPCIGWRAGNDSFLADGRLRRLEIDVFGYSKIFGDVVGRDAWAYHEVQKTVCRAYVWHMLLNAKLMNMPVSFYFAAFGLTFQCYARYKVFWLKIVPLYLVPSWSLRGLRAIVRRLR